MHRQISAMHYLRKSSGTIFVGKASTTTKETPLLPMNTPMSMNLTTSSLTDTLNFVRELCIKPGHQRGSCLTSPFPVSVSRIQMPLKCPKRSTRLQLAQQELVTSPSHSSSLLGPHILPLLVHLSNAIMDSCRFPTIWKNLAIVIPIPKSPNAVEPKDYRPISQVSAVSKIFEKILLDQISNYLDSHQPQLLPKQQSGCRKHHSTTTALTKVTHDIYRNLDDGRCTVMALVDLSLDFNCVNHQKLSRKLQEEFGFRAPACDLFASYLGNRSQLVMVHDRKSAERVLADRTPQGSCFSALLFTLYINSMPDVLHCEYHLYADDLQIYVSGSLQDVHRLITVLNADLDATE